VNIVVLGDSFFTASQASAVRCFTPSPMTGTIG